MEATKRPWIVQRLNHAENEPWYQIGWLENGVGVGPICELSGGAVRSKLPVWHPVAEFKYLIAEEEEIKANAHLIVKAANLHDDLIWALKDSLDNCETCGPHIHPLRHCARCKTFIALLKKAKEE